MKLAVICFVLLAAFASAAGVRDTPSSLLNDIAQVLTDSAPLPQTQPRFVASRVTATTTTAATATATTAAAVTRPEVVTFRDEGNGNEREHEHEHEHEGEGNESEGSEFDSQLAQADEEIKRLKEELEQTRACAKKAREQESELKALEEHREQIEREKEKQALQNKLDKQLKDLTDINRMTMSLKSKFSELKKTQKIIRAKLTGTKTSLNQLENADTSTDDVNESSANIVGDVDAMHEAQKALLDHAHTVNSKVVTSELKNADKLNLKNRRQASEHEDDA